MNPKNFKKGDTVKVYNWHVNDPKKQWQDAIVEKVGREWFYIKSVDYNSTRFNLRTGSMEGGNTTVFTIEDYTCKMELAKAKDFFRGLLAGSEERILDTYRKIKPVSVEHRHCGFKMDGCFREQHCNCGCKECADA